MDSIWFNFKENKSVELYTKFKNKNEINYSKQKFKIMRISDKIKIIDISGQTISFFLINNTINNLKFFTAGCEKPIESYISFHPYEDKKNINLLLGNWVKINSQNEFELPKKLYINKSSIIGDNKISNYSIGLENKFILLENEEYYRVIKLDKDTLSISFNNSIKELEKAIYKRL